MRLWHKDMLQYLPKKMLVSQWRELIAIKRQWDKGTLIHPLVSYVKDYSKGSFIYYVNLVVDELEKRNIKYKRKYLHEFMNFCGIQVCTASYKEHNDLYLLICYYNLYEKYIRGIITKEEWDKVENFMNNTNVEEFMYKEKVLVK